MNYKDRKMNLKLNNEIRPAPRLKLKKNPATIKEERQRTGRYIAILVGICLLLLAIYHAWVRKIPVVASLVVPALIMFIYVGWVLYSANREKHRRLDLEAAITANHLKQRQEALAAERAKREQSSGKNSPRPSPSNSVHKDLSRAPSNVSQAYETRHFIKPIILVNDRPPDDPDDKWTQLVDVISQSEKFKAITSRRKFKRKFCRSKRILYKRSYSIA
ncbi:uncharacterized protein LOC125227937 [Leguminivora glycinivorella]|uniref:uncharacterized protein LOC125227937 n=1 Tax=Leguminivora glycinivorella TaxID=1035111 RepID=UPI00200E4A68|nr:uncharacterized protein LOC125227937 [Leguminivora glycinivorella]